MSATHSTTNYNLPIFIASDSPKWLVDWNGAMNTIDSAINTVATAASGAAGDITTLQSDLQTLSGTVTTQGTSISTLTSSLSTLTGTVNTITSLIGNGEPTTTDKTIIGAINELHSDIQQIVVSVDADDVNYDNTTSGLLATNVQTAIDELAAGTVSAGRKAIFIGDSWSSGYTGQGQPTAPYTDIIESAGIFEDVYKSFGTDAPGFTRGTTFLTQFNTISAGHDDITDVIIEGVVNDIAYEVALTDIVTAAFTLFDTIKTKYPNARIYYIPNASLPANMATGNANMIASITWLCSKFTEKGVISSYKPILSVSYDSDFWIADRVHLTAHGYETFGCNVLAVLTGGECRAYPLDTTGTVGNYVKSTDFTYANVQISCTTQVDRSGNVVMNISYDGTGTAVIQLPDTMPLLPRNSGMNAGQVMGSRVVTNSGSSPMGTTFADCEFLFAAGHYFLGTDASDPAIITYHLRFNIFDPLTDVRFYATTQFNS